MLYFVLKELNQRDKSEKIKTVKTPYVASRVVRVGGLMSSQYNT